MKKFQTTFFVILASALCIQAIRHVHLYFYGAEESVVEQFDEFYGMKHDIELEGSTDDLLAEYETTQEKLSELAGSGQTGTPYELRARDPELYERHDKLRMELTQREMQTRQLRDAWQFSIAAYVLILIGALLYMRGHAWVGMSLVLPGMLELVYWSSPSFTLGGAVREYELLLMNKIVLTTIALAALYALWALSGHAKRTQQP